MRYILDTNILLYYIRQHPLAKLIDDTFMLFEDENDAILSIVSIGELKAIAKMNNWGTIKLNLIDQLCRELIITDIHSEDVIERYAEIDAFSQGKLQGIASNFSARNMGKNDLWIAATASVLGATLLTTDQDFNHLNGIFLSVINPSLP